MMFILSLFFWGFIGLTSIFLFPFAVLIWLITFLPDKNLKILHFFTSFWASLYTWCNPLWRVKINGKENIDPKKTYVYISNHQSFVDVLVLFRLFSHYKWVSKIENFRIPFIGWNMYLNRYIQLKRGSMKSNARMIKDCVDALKLGSSVFIFPEGTRSVDGNIKTFKEGAFEIALRTGLPILPIVINGTSKALPKKGFVLRGKHSIQIKVLPEIPYESFKGKDSKTLTKEIQNMMKDKLEQLKKEIHAGK
ncbi:MAG: 1-acyl-sn-glycerol-3-phosphate acyltransferase [Leptospiraceae bacterium]|nr:1-acyl-sn-glycerol-3-phosphate acyltransferase [Leptospiraceae bacterium]MCP5503122.1 1-acyl-sn-glycerol-3-phosphate acyltransferase [Leptospiraceae bacterium]